MTASAVTIQAPTCIVGRRQFAKALKTLALAMQGKDRTYAVSWPQCVLIEAGDQGVRLTGTDMEAEITVDLPAKVTQPGAVALPWRLLGPMIRQLPGDEVQLSPAPQAWASGIRVTAEDREFILAGVTVEQFRKTPPFTGPAWMLSAQSLRRLLHKTLFATGRDHLRDYLCGVHLTRHDDGRLEAVASNGSRVAGAWCPTDGPAGKWYAMIPTGSARVLGSMWPGATTEPVEVRLEETHASFQMGNVRLVVKLANVEAVDFWKLVPQVYEHAVEVRRSHLLAAGNRVALFGADNLSLRIADGRLHLRTSTQGVGEASESIPCSGAGTEPFEIGFNWALLHDAVKAVDTPRIWLRYISTTRSAVQLDPVTAEPAQRQVVLPLITYR